MRHGTSPDGAAYYPAFPYPSYARMTDQDIADLFAYLATLPAVEGQAEENNLVFPVSQPAAASAWKGLFFQRGPAVELHTPSRDVARGQYLVEGPGHCGSCHTPRNPLGGAKSGRWLSGAEMLVESGFASNLTPHEDGLADWTAEEIVEVLQPADPPVVYEGMEAVRFNLSQLPESDLYAIAAYLQSLPPVASAE